MTQALWVAAVDSLINREYVSKSNRASVCSCRKAESPGYERQRWIESQYQIGHRLGELRFLVTDRNDNKNCIIFLNAESLLGTVIPLEPKDPLNKE
jgi:hypothetical protein